MTVHTLGKTLNHGLKVNTYLLILLITSNNQQTALFSWNKNDQIRLSKGHKWKAPLGLDSNYF